MKIVQLLFFLILFLQNPNLNSSLSPDGLSLLAFKSAIYSSSSSAAVFSDWDENDSNPCHWPGISCMKVHGFPDPRVVGITIAGKNLKGYIPSELGSLIFLRRLNLHGNQLHGSIPDQLFNASSLHSLFLYGNNLTGSLPPSICHLPRLQNLDLSYNALSGEITTSFSSCRELQRLVLSHNKFSGEIPVGIWSKLENLITLDLSSNGFTGEIPNDLGELKSLTGTLNLSFNQFTGEIPKTLEKLPVTVSFDLRNNNLTGEISQKGTFSNQGPTAFLNNPSLCGFPLQKSCQHIENPSPVSSQERGNKPKKGLKPGLIILISVADAAGVALIGLVIIYIYRKQKDSPNGCCSCTRKTKFGSNNHNQNGTMGCSLFSCSCTNAEAEESELDSDKDSHEHSTNIGEQEEGNLVAIDKGFSFELDELLRASAYVLGKSGSGIVYKVVLGNGIPVAVRRLGEGGGQRYKEFVAEIQAIGKLKHPNVVKLRAYYWAPDEKLLICDFISNGNLAFALHGRNGYASGGSSLSWPTRLKIAKGAARGLAYLHECSPRKFVHGDVKPTNILLDNDFNAYIADFGLNRLISITGSDQTSTGGLIGGALPYMKSVQTVKPNYKAPEARVIGMRPTQKWDVYSFGLVLLELLTGRSPESSSSPSMTTIGSSASTSSRGESGIDLVRWVKKGFEVEKSLSEMVDPMLLQEVHAKKEVMAVFQVALACTEPDPEIRPRMKTVSENLDKIGN